MSVHMIGVTVIWHLGDEDDEAGWAPHAILSDGTLSWPMGSKTWDNWDDACYACLGIRWVGGGPVWNKDRVP